ncbi:hypothetical protein COCSADRAFT_38149 [Bipolaris sorokiniana ND90Pr]|uniref:Uncharacterized protein n=1 Tax=Cochliobolus sativus (strain ND90Pr / ATCC 201652) TaxID=665912 RepID=M2S7W3_COCSN|nr:uncharacterized protein COCSADRAFT_38149 [Bipolaris sorokiniana ND90Pr]EMD63288.1 hypothetical protein COCSADRAFT_38149 [Bipolaris sorokiniana ND90Pr]
MSRPLMLRRNFSLLNRVPHSHIVRSAARHGHDSIIIQRVRIRRPFFSNTRLVGTVAVTAAAYGLIQYLGLEIEVEEVQEQGRQDGWEVAGSEEDDEEEEDDDAILFIPTGFSRPRPRTFYKGSDTEWKTFKEIATDRARANKIRKELVSIVRNNAEKKTLYTSRLGKIDTSKGMSWVEIQFPNGPPVEYERPGIELTENLEWRKATRPVEDAHHRRLERVLYPKEATDALCKDTVRKAEKAWKTFKIYMGWDQESKSETVQELFQRISTNRQSTGGPTSIAPNSFSASANDTQQPGASPSPAPVDGPASIGLDLPDPKSMTLDLTQFRADFAKTYMPIVLQPPRGAFIVRALIEIYGDRARLTLNVSAVYDPKQGRYVQMSAVPWNYVEHYQSPKGGS